MDSKAIIKRNFSRHAHRYDSFSVIQDRVGTALLGITPDRGIRSLLDVGCGTGTFTHALAQRFDRASITAVDICPAMIKMAQKKTQTNRIDWTCADAESMVLDRRFDLIASNACFQWFDDLAGAVQRYRQLLTPSGMLAFSAFGPSTLCELSQVMQGLWGDAATVHSGVFHNINVYKTMLQNGWMNVSIDEKIYHLSYDSLWDLLLAIKYTGTKGRGLLGRLLTRGDMTALERDYRACFGRIKASYQVYFCTGTRKD
jgi:malonyl-CoA O-methyltransferase